MIDPQHICPSCGKPRALDGFSGEGGATRGLMAAGFCVTAIDNDPNRLKRNPAPYKILVKDAVEYIRLYGHTFAFRWASPPCQDYSRGTAGIRSQGRVTGHLRLIAATREVLELAPYPWIIENVEDAHREMVDPILLCGRMFGLSALDADGFPLVLDRHRVFESNLALVAPEHPSHSDGWAAGGYGGSRRAKRLPGETLAEVAPRDRYEARYVRKGGYVPRSAAVQEELLGGVTGMTQFGRFLSIPPIYAEYLGLQVMKALESL